MRNNAKIINQDLLYPELSYLVVGVMLEVWKRLGSGFKESVYQKAIEEELRSRNIPFESQKQIAIYYNDKKIGNYIPDFVIDDKIMVEIKHLPKLTFGSEVEVKDRFYIDRANQMKKCRIPRHFLLLKKVSRYGII